MTHCNSCSRAVFLPCNSAQGEGNAICTKKDTDCTDGTEFYFTKRIVFQIIANRLKIANQC